jgi:CheY-like chemotaxis protein
MKKKLLLVDDDIFFLRHMTELLSDKGVSVITANRLREAKTLMQQHDDIEVVVLDIMMPSDGESEFETQMGYRSGLVLARWVKKNYPAITIIGVSAARSRDTKEWFNERDMAFFEKGSVDFVDELLKTVSREEGWKHLKTFIVHGHDEQAKYDLKNYLQNTLKLPEPIILHEQASAGRTIIEKFEEVSRQVDVVFVLLTPDDVMSDATSSNDAKRRARQNVIFEMGYFFGKLQRRQGRVLLLHKGPVELPSDISGLIYVDISNGIPAAGELIRKELSRILAINLN